MMYVVALGNPGPQYAGTRHNVGWFVADRLCERFHLPEPVFKSQYVGRSTRGVIADKEVVFMYPDTFMNHSGVAVKKLVPQGQEAQLVVIHDEVMLPVGDLKVSVGRGDGGHNGIRSIVAQLGTKDFIRVRVGIAPRQFLTGKMKVITGDVLPKFVLGKFSRPEQRLLEDVVPKVADAIEVLVTHGVSVAMNRFN